MRCKIVCLDVMLADARVCIRRFSLHSAPNVAVLIQIEPYLAGLRPKQLDEYHEAFRHTGGTIPRRGSATRTTSRRGSSNPGRSANRYNSTLDINSKTAKSVPCAHFSIRIAGFRNLNAHPHLYDLMSNCEFCLKRPLATQHPDRNSMCSCA